jgi:hypothetical protein
MVEVSKANDVYAFSVLATEVSDPILSEALQSSSGFLCARELIIRYLLTSHDVKLLIAHCCQFSPADSVTNILQCLINILGVISKFPINTEFSLETLMSLRCGY